jgi:uncharacterized protein with HEPN domain
MVRRDVARTRIGRATTWLDDAERLFGVDAGAFLAETKDHEDVGLRNRIAHGYALLDYGRVRSGALTGIPALRSFLAAVGARLGCRSQASWLVTIGAVAGDVGGRVGV